jgi:hypothetical protein
VVEGRKEAGRPRFLDPGGAVKSGRSPVLARGRPRKCRRRAPALPWAKTSGGETRAVYEQNFSAAGRFETAVRRGQRCGRSARSRYRLEADFMASASARNPQRLKRSRQRDALGSSASSALPNRNAGSAALVSGPYEAPRPSPRHARRGVPYRRQIVRRSEAAS